MSKNKTITDLANEAQDAITAFFSAVANAIDSGEVAFTAPTKPEPGSYTTEELEEMDIKSLRDLAKRHGLDTIKKAEIIEALASDEEYEEDDDEEYEDADASADSADSADEPDEDDEDEDEADDEGDDSYSREELEEMNLRELRALAKETGYTAADIKGLDQDALIDLLLGEDDEEYEEEAEEPEEDEDEGDESEEELTEDDLRKMDLTELKEVAAELGVKVTRTMKKDAIVEAILESAE